MVPKPVQFGLAILRWTPVVFISALAVWSYYAYVIQMCLFTVSSVTAQVFYIIFYHPFLFMLLWSYWKTIFTPPGSVPKEFYLSNNTIKEFELEESETNKKELLNRIAHGLPIQTRTASLGIRFCEKCNCLKPDRTHHCSVCGRCVLKMDHHCPWVNNCVSFTSYKFFVLFLGYGLLYCLYVAATSLQYFIQFWMNISSSGAGKFHILFLFFAAVMFSISLVSLFGYHLYLISVNRSTLESFRAPFFRSGPDKDGFSLGCSGNFIEIFGDKKILWFLPIESSRGDGVTFPIRVPPPSLYNSMEQTATVSQITESYGDGVTFPIRTVDNDNDYLLGQRQRWLEEGEGLDNDGCRSLQNGISARNDRS